MRVAICDDNLQQGGTGCIYRPYACVYEKADDRPLKQHSLRDVYLINIF